MKKLKATKMTEESCNNDDSEVKMKLYQGSRRVSYADVVSIKVYSLESLPQGIRRDLRKVALLIYLYFLQGIPLGK